MSKRKKILFGVPHYADVPPQFVISIMNMAMYLVEEKKWNVNTMYSEGSIISQQRNKIAKAAVDESYDYLFFPDADMKFAPEEISKLFAINKDVVGGLYYARRPKHRPIVFKEFDGLHYIGYKQAEIDQMTEPFPCVAVGTGFMLINVELLKEMLKEDFIEKHGYPFNFWQLPNGVQMGEDLSFCYRVREIMGREIWCDPTTYVEHMTTHYVTKETHLAQLQRDIHYCNTISGWMFVKELNWLFEMAMNMETICEIGTWKGRSTHALCSGVKMPGGMVHTVDHFKGSEGECEQHWEAYVDEYDIKGVFMSNVGSRFANCTLHEMSSLEFAEHCKKKGMKFDMVFLDGGHLYEEVIKELEVWLPLTNKVICGHDFQMFPGVTRAVEEFFQSRINVHETIWWKEIGK